MPSHQRARGKILFEALCALGLAASFAGAWDQTGSSALLASASIMALVAIYWSFGLVARDRPDRAAQSAAIVAEAPEAEADIPAREEVFAREPEADVPVREKVFVPEPEAETPVRVEVFPFEPDPPEPESVTPAPRKKRARKAKKVAADVTPVVEQPEPAAFDEPAAHGPPFEPLFEPQPFVRQPRAFGRKARGPRTLQAG